MRHSLSSGQGALAHRCKPETAGLMVDSQAGRTSCVRSTDSEAHTDIAGTDLVGGPLNLSGRDLGSVKPQELQDDGRDTTSTANCAPTFEDNDGRDVTSTANCARTSEDDGNQPVPAIGLLPDQPSASDAALVLEEPTAGASASELPGSPLTFYTTDGFSVPAYTRPHTAPPSAVSVTTPATSPAELSVVTHVPSHSSAVCASSVLQSGLRSRIDIRCRLGNKPRKPPDKGEPLYQDSFQAANRKLADLKNNNAGFDDELIEEPSNY